MEGRDQGVGESVRVEDVGGDLVVHVEREGFVLDIPHDFVLVVVLFGRAGEEF